MSGWICSQATPRKPHGPIDCSVDGTDVRGPYIQGRPGSRFIYLNWGISTTADIFRCFGARS